jgi:hypothetical protein
LLQKRSNNTLNGLSLIEHIHGKRQKLLVLAEEAIKSKKNTDENINKQTQERYVQALIWNKNTNCELKISS